jgi:TrpR-related protein YerC/YecD
MVDEGRRTSMAAPRNNEDWRNDSTAALMDSIVALGTRDEAARFFRDLCTRHELEEMASRWAVVRQLAAGHPYREIHDITGVSTATITRISQWLRHGTGGYREALERAGNDLAGDE